jgi:methylenetetrahydrofolate dehydrogenase (NADP+)/methenyltetrahydrofolate cyclohydrolase
MEIYSFCGLKVNACVAFPYCAATADVALTVGSISTCISGIIAGSLVSQRSETASAPYHSAESHPKEQHVFGVIGVTGEVSGTIFGLSIDQRGRMGAAILDGNKIASVIRAEVAAEVKNMIAAGTRPGLAVVLVGHNPASEVYVRGKVKACEEVGIYSEKHTPPETASTDELLELVAGLNRRDEIDGILVQLPLPKQVDAKKVLMAVDPAKDVDGFHPMNVGFLSTQRPGLVSCTPAGIMEILKRSKIPIAGQEAVVVGRSDIVGKPTAMLLINANATVTICHSKTRDLPGVCRRADILLTAIGRAGMITRDFVKPGATVIDVGMNTVKDRTEFERLFAGNAKREEMFRSKGSTLVGDVHPEVAQVAGAITPVPGGVGPLTISMLMANTVRAAKMRRGVRELSRA